MKLIIDTSEEDLDCIKYLKAKGWASRHELQILNGTPLDDVLDKIRAEIAEKYGNYDICEWDINFDYEENDISEYQQVGKVSDILAIIDKAESEE